MPTLSVSTLPASVPLPCSWDVPLTSRAQLGPARRQGFHHQARTWTQALSSSLTPFLVPQGRQLSSSCPRPHLPPAAESDPLSPPVWILPQHWTTQKTLQHLLWARAMPTAYSLLLSICPVLFRVLSSILSNLGEPTRYQKHLQSCHDILHLMPFPSLPPLKITCTSMESRLLSSLNPACFSLSSPSPPTL